MTEQQVHDRAEGGSSRLLAWLVAPFVAVVPWLVTFLAVCLLASVQFRMQTRYEAAWGMVFAGLLVLVVAAVMWAALTVWSSSGAIVAGLCTLLLGLFSVTGPGMSLVFRMGRHGPDFIQQSFYSVAGPATLILFGSLLLAMGLGAAGARRLGARRR